MTQPRKGPGRPPGPPTKTVSFRVLETEYDALVSAAGVLSVGELCRRLALRLAKKAGHKTVSAWCKDWVEGEVGE